MEPRQKPKGVVKGKYGVVSSSHLVFSKIMIDVLRDGGNVVDAAVATSLTGPVYKPHMITICGDVSFLSCARVKE